MLTAAVGQAGYRLVRDTPAKAADPLAPAAARKPLAVTSRSPVPTSALASAAMRTARIGDDHTKHPGDRGTRGPLARGGYRVRRASSRRPADRPRARPSKERNENGAGAAAITRNKDPHRYPQTSAGPGGPSHPTSQDPSSARP